MITGLKKFAGRVRRYFDATIAGRFQVPFPGGKIGGGVSFGDYRRITRLTVPFGVGMRHAHLLQQGRSVTRNSRKRSTRTISDESG